MPMQPSPMAETSRLLLPSVRFFIPWNRRWARAAFKEIGELLTPEGNALDPTVQFFERTFAPLLLPFPGSSPVTADRPRGAALRGHTSLSYILKARWCAAENSFDRDPGPSEDYLPKVRRLERWRVRTLAWPHQSRH